MIAISRRGEGRYISVVIHSLSSVVVFGGGPSEYTSIMKMSGGAPQKEGRKKSRPTEFQLDLGGSYADFSDRTLIQTSFLKITSANVSFSRTALYIFILKIMSELSTSDDSCLLYAFILSLYYIFRMFAKIGHSTETTNDD